jgi:type IV secretion system protein VirD4
MPSGNTTVTHPVVREKVQEMLDKEERDFGGVLSTAKTALTLYSDPLVANNTSASDFTIEDLVNHERPVSLYLVVPPSDKIRLRPLIRLMLTMTVNRLTEKMVFQGAEQKRNRHRLLLLIDEFPSPGIRGIEQRQERRIRTGPGRRPYPGPLRARAWHLFAKVNVANPVGTIQSIEHTIRTLDKLAAE